jgi:hypothetical protein
LCIIIHKPAKTKLERPVVLECFRKNPDGAGICFIENEELVIKKGIRSADIIADLVEKNMEKELVIHFRVASKGMITDNENTHPFLVEAQEDEEKKLPRFQYAVSHNGTLEWGHTNTKSDTNLFTEQFLTPMFESHPWVLTYEWGMIALERTILHKDRLNKMVIMMYDRKLKESEVFIVNEPAGNRKDGIWFSNYSWMPPIVQEDHGFFPGGGHGSRSMLVDLENELSSYKYWCEPDVHGWFWSYGWDAWINAKTFAISRDLTRMPPKYFNAPDYKPKELAGRIFLTQEEVFNLLVIIRNQIYMLNKQITAETGRIASSKPKQLILPSEDKKEDSGLEDASLPHLTGQEKSLICKKAYDVLKWAGVGKKEVSKMNAMEKVKELRQWVQGIFDTGPEAVEIENMKNSDLDHWIIAKIKSGDMSIEKIDKMWESKYDPPSSTTPTQNHP